MQEITSTNMQSLIQTIQESTFPDWAKTTMALSIVLTPLFRILVPLILLKQIADLLAKLLAL